MKTKEQDRSNIRWFQLGIGILLTALVVYLIAGPKPWIDGVAGFESAEKRVKTPQYVVSGLWWSGLGLVPLFAALLGFARWFLKPLETQPLPALNLTRSSTLLVSILLGLACLLLLWFTYPRMNLSLWFDEEYTMRKAVVSDHSRKQVLEEIRDRPVTWTDTLWFYGKPNNHIAFSIAARAAHSLVPATKDPERFHFNEAALRTPALLAGLASLGVVSMLFLRLGAPVAAVGTPFLLAIHPWFIRYASEARGYAFLFLFSLLSLLALTNAIQTGRWRSWISLGIFQFLAVYSNPSAASFLILLHLSALLLIWRTPTSASFRSVQFRRWLLANLLSGATFIFLFSPCYLPLQEYLVDVEGSNIDRNWFNDFVSLIATGISWAGPEQPHLLYLKDALKSPLSAGMLWLGTALLLFVLGVVRFLKMPKSRGLLLIPLLGTGPLIIGQSALKDIYMYPWYAIAWLPLVFLILGAGLDTFASLHKRAPVIIMTVSIAAFFLTSMDQRNLMMTVPMEDSRGSVLATREIVNLKAPGYEDALTIGFCNHTRGYDPGLQQIRNAEDLAKVMAVADESGRPLYVNYGMEKIAQIHFPEIMRILEDKTLFSEKQTFHSLQPFTTRYVLRYLPTTEK